MVFCVISDNTNLNRFKMSIATTILFLIVANNVLADNSTTLSLVGPSYSTGNEINNGSDTIVALLPNSTLPNQHETKQPNKNDKAAKPEHLEGVSTSSTSPQSVVEKTTVKEKLPTSNKIPVKPPSEHVTTVTTPVAQNQPQEKGMGAAGILGIFFVVMMIVSGAGLVYYAYRFPHSKSGQFLISQCRPSRWTFRRRDSSDRTLVRL